MSDRKIRILGIDPGSRFTGYGCVEVVGRTLTLITHGTLRLENEKSSESDPLHDRLLKLYQGLKQIIETHQPTILVVENVFFAKNALSALKLGQARGVVLLAGVEHGLVVFEYAATEVKKAIAGHGRADKHQVARVLQLMLGKQGFETTDASDGLALAVYHAHSTVSSSAKSQVGPARQPGVRKSRHRSIADAVKHVTKR